MKEVYWLAIGIGLSYVIWPVLVRIANINPYWSALIISAAAMLFPGLMIAKSDIPLPSLGGWIITLAAGAISGIGLAFYAKIGVDKTIDLSSVIPLIAIAVILFSALAGMAMGEPITIKKIIGLIGAIIGVVLLSS